MTRVSLVDIWSTSKVQQEKNRDKQHTHLLKYYSEMTLNDSFRNKWGLLCININTDSLNCDDNDSFRISSRQNSKVPCTTHLSSVCLQPERYENKKKMSMKISFIANMIKRSVVKFEHKLKKMFIQSVIHTNLSPSSVRLSQRFHGRFPVREITCGATDYQNARNTNSI